jgi:hypothetical protein
MSNVTPKAGHNNPPMDVPNTAALVREAHAAVEQAIASKNIEGSAVQLMAHAIMCAHYAEVHDAGKIAPLASIIGSTQGTSDVRSFMEERLELKLERQTAPSYDAKAERKDTGTARRALLARGLEFACYLAKCNVEFTAYEADKQCFSLPRRLIVADGETALGSLASTDPVLLDRRSYMVQFLADDGKEGGRTIQASVARFLQVQKPAKKRAAGGTQSEADKNKSTSRDFSDSLKHIVQIVQDTSADKFNAADYTDEDVNNLTALTRLLHRIQKARIPEKAAPTKRTSRKAA